MKNWFVLGMLLIQSCYADDYSDGRNFALNAQTDAVLNIGRIQPNEYLNQYTEHPSESTLDHERLEEEGRKKAATDETAQHIIANAQTGERVDIDLNSEEMTQAGTAIEHADEVVNQNNIPCKDGACLPSTNEPGDDFGDGVTQLGALGGVSDEVRSNQVKSKNPRIFSGVNAQCRTVVKPIGSCCHDNAHLMRCSKTEKALAVAKKESRAFYVGTYCALSKLGICLEYKESWCMFPTKLSSIIQIQGRYGQLKISFGKTKKKENKANCRGITPEELQRINFQNLNLSSLTEEYKSHATPKEPGKINSNASQKIEQMEREGRHHG